MMNWIVCPVRDGLHYTKAAMKTFLAQDIGEVSVLFVDNASTDGTREWTWGLPDRAHLFHFEGPLSVAASWNTALSFVFNWRREVPNSHALVVNNDVLLRPDTYRLLVEDGGLFVTAVGRNDPECVRELTPPRPDAKRPHPDFSCFLIRRECWERVGAFDERFESAYCEDSDYHVRMHRAGIQASCLDLPFYHAGAGTIKSAEPKEARRISEQADRNRALFKQIYGVGVGSPEYYRLFNGEGLAAEAEG